MVRFSFFEAKKNRLNSNFLILSPRFYAFPLFRCCLFACMCCLFKTKKKKATGRVANRYTAKNSKTKILQSSTPNRVSCRWRTPDRVRTVPSFSSRRRKRRTSMASTSCSDTSWKGWTSYGKSKICPAGITTNPWGNPSSFTTVVKCQKATNRRPIIRGIKT